MAATVEGLKAFLGYPPATDRDDTALAAAVAAANAAVVMWRHDLAPPGDLARPWPAGVDQAATIYAARLYGRRGSIQGVVAYQEMGVTMRSTDPDCWALLQLGGYQDSVVA